MVSKLGGQGGLGFKMRVSASREKLVRNAPDLGYWAGSKLIMKTAIREVPDIRYASVCAKVSG